MTQFFVFHKYLDQFSVLRRLFCYFISNCKHVTWFKTVYTYRIAYII